MQPHESATPAAHDDVAASKRSLRTELRARRRSRVTTRSSAQRNSDAHEVVRHLAEHAQVREARCIALYEALPTEEDVAPLTELAARVVRFLVPITHEDRDLSWRDLATAEDLGKHGIAEADVVVVPALAIGAAGERLGQGGGSYDRALPRRAPGVPVIAVVFPDEVGLEIPMETHDEPVNAVVTSEGLTIF